MKLLHTIGRLLGLNINDVNEIRSIDLSSVYKDYSIEQGWIVVSNSSKVKRFPISKIKDIKHPENCLKPPVLSLDNFIEISFNDNRPTLMLSPDDIQQFIMELKEVNSNIQDLTLN